MIMASPWVQPGLLDLGLLEKVSEAEKSEGLGPFLLKYKTAALLQIAPKHLFDSWQLSSPENTHHS